MAKHANLWPIARGEWVLMNPGAIYFEPSTGEFYQEPDDDWTAERDKLLDEAATIPWWQFRRQLGLNWRAWRLRNRLGK